MKNKLLLIIFLIIHCSFFAQVRVFGTVKTTSNVPLEGAAVYFNNTMIGTTTNAEGKFSLIVTEKKQQLIVSFLGYTTTTYTLEAKNHKQKLLFILEEEENMLDEIVIQKTKYNQYWKHNLETFKREFIGLTTLSKTCKILNPKVLHFNYDASKNILTATAREPLKIEHKGLGYLIIYDLVSFIREGNYVSYLGYTQYRKLKGNKRTEKRWQENRILTYNGSPFHFYKAAINHQLKEEGFNVALFKRVFNKNRPSEKDIRAARSLIRSHRKNNQTEKVLKISSREIDTAYAILKKAKLPKFKDFVYQQNSTHDSIISLKNNSIYLDFKDNLSVVYNREKEEKGYLLRTPFSKRKDANFQHSYIIPSTLPSQLSEKGILVNPLDVIYEGYWSFEKFANSLPLDYSPNK